MALVIKRPIIGGHQPKSINPAPLNPPSGGSSGRPALKTGPKPSKPAEPDTPPKSITVRMPGNHMTMLEEIMQFAECDKSEAVKRSIRREHSILSATDAKLTLTAHDGTVSTVTLVKHGVPI